MGSTDGKYKKEAEKWGVVEVACHGREDGNPFVDYRIEGIFSGLQETVRVDGFYDGNGVYRVRFMPSFEGRYHFVVRGDCLEQEVDGEFCVGGAQQGNHGPVRTVNTFHFAYEDGTPYYPAGTACHAWWRQEDAMIEETLLSVREAGFNKIRFMVLPKQDGYMKEETKSCPYMRKGEDIPARKGMEQADRGWEAGSAGLDYQRFNPAYFQHMERCIERLGELGAEADMVLFHPYGNWGFTGMEAKEDELYISYVLARFAAYRNVWWSLAEEYDMLPGVGLKDWERYAGVICRKDPYRHLRSIQGRNGVYDNSRPWITHCSVRPRGRNQQDGPAGMWRERYGKPVLLDGMAYEGNLSSGWGNLSGKELVRRFWDAALKGIYPGHGEAYPDSNGICWWSHGGSLLGESYKRLKFLLKILQDTPGYGLMPYSGCSWDEISAVPEECSLYGGSFREYYLYYYGYMCPAYRDFCFGGPAAWDVEVIDTWNMTFTGLGEFCGNFRVPLPGRPYMAVRIRRKISGEE